MYFLRKRIFINFPLYFYFKLNWTPLGPQYWVWSHCVYRLGPSHYLWMFPYYSNNKNCSILVFKRNFLNSSPDMSILYFEPLLVPQCWSGGYSFTIDRMYSWFKKVCIVHVVISQIIILRPILDPQEGIKVRWKMF